MKLPISLARTSRYAKPKNNINDYLANRYKQAIARPVVVLSLGWDDEARKAYAYDMLESRTFLKSRERGFVDQVLNHCMRSNLSDAQRKWFDDISLRWEALQSVSLGAAADNGATE